MLRVLLLVLQDCAGIIEKRELAEKVKQAASQGPEGQVSTVPVGYAFDPSSGDHKHRESSLISAYCLFRCVTYALYIDRSDPCCVSRHDLLRHRARQRCTDCLDLHLP